MLTIVGMLLTTKLTDSFEGKFIIICLRPRDSPTEKLLIFMKW